MITEDDLNKLEWFQSYHGNKGYDRDELGNSQEPHLGYVWGYRCAEYPRIVWESHVMSPSDKPDWEAWRVDGEPCKDLADALERLTRPPSLTLYEFAALTLLRTLMPIADEMARDAIAGSPNPTPNFIDGKWGRASSVITRLRDKGLVKYNEGMLEDASLS